MYFRMLFILNRLRVSNPQCLTSPRSNPQNQIKSVASSASDRNSNQFQSTLILWFNCNKKKQLSILIINHVHVQNWKLYIMLISILHIPVYPSTYISHASFFIIIKSTTTHFIFFFFTGVRDMDIYFFSPPSLANSLHTYYFFFNYCYFVLE